MNLDDVAYLFVEQYEMIHGLFSEHYRKSEVDMIRRSADKGESALYTVLATIFGERLEDAMIGAANGAMDYIAYVDETWAPKDADNKANTMAMEEEHLESLEAILRMALMNECGVVKELKGILHEAKAHFQRLEQREISQ